MLLYMSAATVRFGSVAEVPQGSVYGPDFYAGK
jgi:hypothetical protein